jgi:hypothetical protein
MIEENKKQEVLDALHESGKSFMEAQNQYQDMTESYWTGLEPEEQLWAFCAMMRRLCKAELDEGRSYRGTLYDVFGWGPEAYAAAQLSGFMDLHNSIYKFEDLVHVVKSTLETLEIEVDSEKLSSAVAKHFY